MIGFLCVDKPKGLSSFDIIRIVRGGIGIKKVGHNGTLDPEATGLLVLALGKATRLLPFLQSEPKTYEFSIQFGKTTNTLDNAGSVIEQDKPIPSVKVLGESIGAFQGRVLQKPPIHSAIKIKGKPAYRLARQKRVFDIPEREVTIHSLHLLNYNEKKGEAFLKTVCSKGTYIRSLSRDIAQKAGTLGYASSIRRIAIGNFDVQNAATVEDIQKDAQKHLIPINDILASLPSYTASSLQMKEISHGNEIEVDNNNNSTILFIYSPRKELIAVAKNISQSKYHPVKVFI